MPKFKEGDAVTYAKEPTPITIKAIVRVEGIDFYAYSDDHGVIEFCAVSYFDLYSKPYTKYVKGDIWLSADKSKAFIVENENYMSRLFALKSLPIGGGKTGHNPIRCYEEDHGPLIKWESAYRG